MVPNESNCYPQKESNILIVEKRGYFPEKDTFFVRLFLRQNEKRRDQICEQKRLSAMR